MKHTLCSFGAVWHLGSPLLSGLLRSKVKLDNGRRKKVTSCRLLKVGCSKVTSNSTPLEVDQMSKD